MFQNLFAQQNEHPDKFIQSSVPDSNESEIYTLKEYSFDHFRIPAKKTLSKTLTISKRKRQDDLWRHGKDPIKQPLLKKLQGKEDLSQEACQCYLAILKYMGDHPTPSGRRKSDLTDLIFEPPIKQVCI